MYPYIGISTYVILYKMERKPIPYIGITGFTKKDEVTSALVAYPENHERLLMVGVLASYKTLRDIALTQKWQDRYPNPVNISTLFTDDPRVLNLVHFNTEAGQESSVLADMIRIHNIAGPNFHGFQLNMAWPEIRQLDEYRMAFGFIPRIVLQLGRRAMEIAGNTPQGVTDMLYNYVGLIDDVLFDPSGGRGQPFDTERANQFLSAIADKGWGLGLGVAGGLGPDSLYLVEPLLKKFPNLSFDAEGLLRNPNNDLNPQSVKAYIRKATLSIYCGK